MLNICVSHGILFSSTVTTITATTTTTTTAAAATVIAVVFVINIIMLINAKQNVRLHVRTHAVYMRSVAFNFQINPVDTLSTGWVGQKVSPY